jgi:hypothetical protein
MESTRNLIEIQGILWNLMESDAALRAGAIF